MIYFSLIFTGLRISELYKVKIKQHNENEFYFDLTVQISNLKQKIVMSHDNAVAKVFPYIKTELIHHEIYHTKEQAKRSIFEYIEVFYNRERSHSANNNLSPVEFEEKQKLLQKKLLLRDYNF